MNGLRALIKRPQRVCSCMWGCSEKTGCLWTSQWALTKTLNQPEPWSWISSLKELWEIYFRVFSTTRSMVFFCYNSLKWLRPGPVCILACGPCVPAYVSLPQRLLSTILDVLVFVWQRPSHCACWKLPPVALDCSFSDSDSPPGRLEDELLSGFSVRLPSSWWPIPCQRFCCPPSVCGSYACLVPG